MAQATSKKSSRWLGRGFLLLLGLLLAHQLWFAGHILYWRFANPEVTAFMAYRLDELRQERPEAALIQVWVPYDKIARSLKRAVVASEDAKFATHQGFDWDGIQVALEKNIKKGRIVAGGSTISQQLAKNLFLSPERTPWRKLQEAIITVMLEQLLDKKRILEIYLNVIEWGDGIFGAEAAARHHYKTSAAALSNPQAAKLAAMVPNPRYYDTRMNNPALNRKTSIILQRMGSAVAP